MKIEWKKIDNKEIQNIDSWLSNDDKHNLCMTEKSWEQTAEDINDCLKYMENAQFKNLIGYINNKPAIALMFGIEQGEILNLYNIWVNPMFRGYGVATYTIKKLLNKESSLNITKPYKKVDISVLPENQNMQKILSKIGFKDLGYNGEYVVFEKTAISLIEKDREI